MPKNWSSQLRFFIIIAVSVIFFDQVSKYQAVAHLTRAFEIPTGTAELGFVEKVDIFLTLRHPVRAEAVSVVDNFWHFRYVENPGAAWGFLSGAASWFRTPFFLIVSLAAMAFIIVYYRRTTPEQRYLRLALALVLGGAIGNFLDRVRLSYVIDFIDWHWYDKATWPTFNVADSAITVGVTIMVLDMLLAGKAAPKEKTTAKAKGST
ncbi:MAG: signal peptidase II [Deltaproteobacteria bacterium RIFOXYA12_FULL_58_15]|nr:MAG: signal peptidase II [Deltaproteobacteria bacterium RIFOXYA12_FULL_58_15]OGR15017.1 MAG: signal peptidase II [Deltaproteobacteria bacterium RIFOXYB12_FULL_58_9]